jgi:hypothetical protein
MFIIALFTIAKLWKQPTCPKTDEWIMKFVIYIHSGILLSHKNNDIEFEGKWMQLENIMLSEFSQDQKHKRCMLSFIRGRYIQR